MAALLGALVSVAKARTLNMSDVAQDSTLITSVSLNSRELEDQSLFAALPGTRTHGAVYAASTPAVAVLTDEAGAIILQEKGESRPILVVEDVRAILGRVSAEVYNHPGRELTIIGITGTSGKTTTSYLLESGLLAAGYKAGLIGTTGTRINGRPVPSHLTTPEAPDLQRLLSRMREQNVTHVVMEISSHAIALGRVTGTPLTIAAFTNLSQDHLDFHKTMEDYFSTKARLFNPRSELKADNTVVCTDDDWGVRLQSIAQNPVTVGTHGQAASFRARDIAAHEHGTQSFTACLPSGDAHHVSLPIPGEFNVANAMIAVACASVIAVDIPTFIQGLQRVGVPGRMERIEMGQDFVAVVDYAHKPAAVAAVLDSLKEQTSGRVAVVVGAGGDRDHGKRPKMGAEAARRADMVIVTDDNPRSEDPAQIRQQVLEGARSVLAQQQEAGVSHPVELKEIGDRAQAIRAAVRWAQSGDALIIAGKGHETGQLIAGVMHHFDDREELRTAIAESLKEHESDD